MKKVILTSLASLLLSFTAYGQFDTVVDGTTSTTDQVVIGQTDVDGNNKLTVQGAVNIGGTSGAHLKVRVIDGKKNSGTGIDHLYLNWNNGKHVFVGNMNATQVKKSNLYVSGNVGIGTSSPKAQLHVGDRYIMSSNSNGWTVMGQNIFWNSSGVPTRLKQGATCLFQFNPDGDLNYQTAPSGAANGTLTGQLFNRFSIKNDGRIGIGLHAHELMEKTDGTPIASSQYKLFVETGILTEKVRVALKSTNDWADYVFEEDYELNAIEEVEDFVKENKHLPNIPSAQEMVNKGLNVAEMDAKLLRQIEELWLHTIQTNKRNNDLQAQLEEVIKQNSELSKRLEKLEE